MPSGLITVSGWPGLKNFTLGRTIERYSGCRPCGVYKCAATLAEMRHAFFDRINGKEMKWHYSEDLATWLPDHDDWVSPGYRESFQASRGLGEWTANFLGPREPSAGEAVPEGYTPAWFYTPIDESERVFRDPQSGLWIAECDSKHKVPVLLPPEGLVLEYDKPTGFPVKTLLGDEGRKAAENIFGSSRSYFLTPFNLLGDSLTGLRAVVCDHNRTFHFDGLFDISSYDPDYTDWNIGVRPVSRHEPLNSGAGWLFDSHSSRT